MTGLLRSSTDGLGQIAQDMRGMTGVIHQELEATREELRRGVLAMPKETEENTAAIRRVVSEQIRALNALTEIATRHGGLHDAVEPRRLEAVTSEGSRTARRVEAKPVASRPAPQREERPSQSAATNERGWLGGLLARAAEDEETVDTTAQARSTLSSLDSLSADIGQFINTDAMMDAWDRYRRGEDDVFTRRLYTRDGAKTFDDLRRRYGQNAEFRQTVDRYVSEFERLLEDATRDEANPEVAKAYLTSDTGKVYTLLAHAAGRLDEKD
jgi:enamine deaminase RidA (YjgF/YER057c/UK114 family)